MTNPNPSPSPSSRRAELAILSVCIVWGLNFSVMKIGLEELHPLGFNALRLAISTLVLGASHFALRARAARDGVLTHIPKATWPQVFGLALLGYFLYQVVFMAGLQRTASGNAAILVASAPAFTFLVANLRGDRPPPAAWLGMLVAFGGTASIAVARGVDLGSELLTGNLLVLLSAVAWGSFTALYSGAAKAIAPATLAFYCTLAVLPLHWAIGIPHLEPLWRGELSSTTWLALLYSGALGTGLAVVLFNIGLRGVGPAYTAGLISLVPVMAVLVGYLALDEPITILQLIGGVCVIGGVSMIRRARRTPRALPSPRH